METVKSTPPSNCFRWLVAVPTVAMVVCLGILAIGKNFDLMALPVLVLLMVARLFVSARQPSVRQTFNKLVQGAEGGIYLTTVSLASVLCIVLAIAVSFPLHF